MKGKYLITTDAFFTAPDGRSYDAVWGEVEVLEDSYLGIKTNRNSSNWYLKVGNEDNHVLIAGCQIHYAVKCNEPPKKEGEIQNVVDGVCKISEIPHKIYVT